MLLICSVTDTDEDTIDKLWLNSNASFPNAFTELVVSLKLNLKFLRLAFGTNHSTSHQSFAISLL
jgi:hypothetical protein